MVVTSVATVVEMAAAARAAGKVAAATEAETVVAARAAARAEVRAEEEMAVVRAAAERAAARAALLPQPARDVGGCAPGWPLPRQW